MLFVAEGPVIANAKQAHTDLVARDWRSLVRFYRDVFGCVPVPPERDFSGPARGAHQLGPAEEVVGVERLGDA